MRARQASKSLGNQIAYLGDQILGAFRAPGTQKKPWDLAPNIYLVWTGLDDITDATLQ